MFQPEVKYEFIRQFCSPRDGWAVFVDIDASEEGRTGGERKSETARRNQLSMQKDAKRVRGLLAGLDVQVGGNRATWFQQHDLPVIEGDRDVIAFHTKHRKCLIAEVEGNSSGQPEQRLYKAIGQIVTAVGTVQLSDWSKQFVLVVHGERIAKHLERAHVLSRLGVGGLSIAEAGEKSRWVFQPVGMGGRLSHAGADDLHSPDDGRMLTRAM